MDKRAINRETMLRVLAETVQYYGENPERRGVDLDGGCRYHIDGRDGEPARMCAVGRCLTDPAKIALKFPFSISMVADELGWESDQIFRPEYRGLPLDFWSELQNWHDNCSNWDKGGLTPVGEARATMMKLKIETGGFA